MIDKDINFQFIINAQTGYIIKFAISVLKDNYC